MKKVMIFLVILLGIGLGTFYWGYNYYNEAIEHPLVDQSELKITVKKGDSLYSLLDRLYNQKKIKNPIVFKLYVKRNNVSTFIQPGEYSIGENENFNDMLAKIRELNKRESFKVTVVEGMNIEQIAEVFGQSGVFTKDQFLQAVLEYEVPSYVKKNEGAKYAMEGYLYPDTYEFFYDVTPRKTIEMMHNKLLSVIDEIKNETGEEINDLHEVITLASIVEKEAVVEEDRPKIASVYLNRLKIDMPLQSCPTVIYSIGNDFYKRDSLVVLNKDLEVESAYNTYKQRGLPPGPIGAPRKASIVAAVIPDETDFLYFVSQNDGTHFFTRNYNEFLKVKAKTQGN